MKIFSSVFFFILFSTIIIGQPTQWLNYSNVDIIFDVAFEEEFIWLGTRGGVLKLDRNTGEQLTKYQAWNSGMAEHNTHSVAVDHNGVKWFGSRDGGLTRFDDTSWENFYFLDSINVLRSLDEMKIAPNNDLWFITEWGPDSYSYCGRFYQYDDTTFTRHDLNLPNSNGDCYWLSDFSFDSSGDIWIASSHGLIHYNGETTVALYNHLNSPLDSLEIVYHVEVDSNDNVWFSTAERLIKFDGTNWSIEMPSVLINSNTGIFLDEADNIWISSKSGIYWNFARFDGTEWTHTNYTDFSNPPLFDNGTPAIPIYADTSGYFWMKGNPITSNNNTFYKVNTNTGWTAYESYFDNFSSLDYSPLVVDCDHGVWVTPTKKYNGETWETLDLSVFPSFWADYIAYDEITCELWMRRYQGVTTSVDAPVDVAKFDGDTLEGYNVFGIWNDTRIMAAHNGVAWVEIGDGPMKKYENGVWTSVGPSNSPLSNTINVHRIQFDDFGNTWFSDENYKLIKLDAQGNWQVFNDNNNIPGVKWLLTVDESGMVWCSHDVGLARFDGVNWEIFPLPELEQTVSGYTAVIMVEDQYNHFWISTFGKKVFYWDGINLTTFDKFNSKLSSNTIRQIAVDHYGNVWFNESFALTVFNENYITERLLPPPIKAQGQTYFDSAQDGTFSVDEDFPLPGEKVWLYPDSIMSFSNSVGTYTFFPGPGSYTVNHVPEEPFLPVSPSVLNFDITNNFIDGLNFGNWTDELLDSISLNISNSITVCSQSMMVWVTVTNHGLLPTSGNLSITFDDLTQYNNSFPEGVALTGNTASWSFSNLGYNNSKFFTLELAVPDFNSLGEELNFHAIAESLEDGIVLSSAEDETSEIVLCSYDPNDKLSESSGISAGQYSEITDPLDYTIRFQNTGNYTAFKVVLVDTLDKKLDPNTLVVLGSSAPVRTEISNDGVVTFTFDDINLPPEEEDFIASQGFVKFRISPHSNLLPPISIFNIAYIYFDHNEAIVTNFTQNVLIDEIYVSTSHALNKGAKPKIYPNPSNADITISWEGIMEQDSKWEVKIFDIAGNQIRDLVFTGSKGSVQQLPQGCFFITINKGQEFITKKVVILSPY